MGAGKTSIGKRVAALLGLPFRDADEEIEKAAGRTVGEIFANLGEPAFRDGERRVIARLLGEPQHILATGGGALTHPETLEMLKSRAFLVWLKVDLEVLARRVGRKDTRPLLIGKNPLDVLTAQSAARYPLFEQSHLTLALKDSSHSESAEEVIAGFKNYVKGLKA